MPLRLPLVCRLLVVLPVLLLTARCTSSADEAGADASSATVPDSINTLTDAERRAGWRLLFDGASLTGWRGFRRDSVPRGWTVENGAMHFTGAASPQDGAPPRTLVTTDRYADFVLRLEWKISPRGNSGVMYRVSEEAPLPYMTGPEYQILDHAVLGDSAAAERSGALFSLIAPSTDATKPVGEFNETRIVVRGGHVEHWLNGTKLLEAEMGSDMWTRRTKGTKFASWPRFARPDTGRIAFQDHGYPVWFRDVKIRPLPAEAE
ncbi:MAG: DUF1080 domain-containing protein [Salinibacter sp.]